MALTVKNLLSNAEDIRDMGSITRLGRLPRRMSLDVFSFLVTWNFLRFLHIWFDFLHYFWKILDYTAFKLVLSPFSLLLLRLQFYIHIRLFDIVPELDALFCKFIFTNFFFCTFIVWIISIEPSSNSLTFLCSVQSADNLIERTVHF